MVMLVDERRETVGILRLIGLRPGRILMQVLLEGLVIAVAGALFGLVLARAVSEGADQPLLPVALRHRAGLRAHHAGIALAVVLLIAVPLGVAGHAGRVLGAAAPQRAALAPR